MRIMIIGGGDLSSTLASFLCRDNEIICIAKDRVVLAPVEKLPNMTLFEGNGANSTVLEKAGVRDCDSLISLMSKDEANIIACCKAKGYGIKKTAALVNDEDNIQTSNLLSIGYTINPARIEVENVIDIIESPGINDIHYFAERKLKLVGYAANPGGSMGKLSEHSLNLPEGCKICGVVRNYQEFLPPVKDINLESGDIIYVLGKTKVMDGYSVFSRKELLNHNIVIAGSKDNHISLELAKYFSNAHPNHLKVKVILNDHELFNHIQDSYPGLSLVYGDLNSKNLLNKTNIDQADLFIGGTGSDELNIFTATLAKKLGAKKTLALVSKYDYPLISRDLEIDRIVTPTFTTVAEISKYLFEEELINYSILQGGKCEVLEIKINAISFACGKKLTTLKMPYDAEIGAIYRNGTIIFPSPGESCLPDDRVVVISPAHVTTQVYQLFA
jgi:trk system potassium uptake protein